MENNVLKTDIEREEGLAEPAETEEQRELRRRKARRFNRVLYCISAALILLGVFIILRSETTLFTKNSGTDVPSATFPPDDVIVINAATPTPAAPSPVTEDPSAATPTYPPPSEAPEPIPPTAIYFVEHGVSCLVEPVGVDENGVMDTIDSHNVVAWYTGAAAPNTHGNCIIAGHNRFHGQMGSFSLLHNGLAIGDRVTVELADGSSRFYRVATINTYNYKEIPFSVMQVDGIDRLTLITCLGDYDYNLQMSVSRVVAVCTPVE